MHMWNTGIDRAPRSNYRKYAWGMNYTVGERKLSYGAVGGCIYIIEEPKGPGSSERERDEKRERKRRETERGSNPASGDYVLEALLKQSVLCPPSARTHPPVCTATYPYSLQHCKSLLIPI